MQENRYKNYNIKEGYVVQTKIFNWDYVLSLDWQIKEKTEQEHGDAIYDNKTGKRCFSSWETQILYYLNEFASTVNVLEIITIAELGSTYYGGTFSKTSSSFSKTPQFLLVYQIPKNITEQNQTSVRQEKQN